MVSAGSRGEFLPFLDEDSNELVIVSESRDPW